VNPMSALMIRLACWNELNSTNRLVSRESHALLAAYCPLTA